MRCGYLSMYVTMFDAYESFPLFCFDPLISRPSHDLDLSSIHLHLGLYTFLNLGARNALLAVIISVPSPNLSDQ